MTKLAQTAQCLAIASLPDSLWCVHVPIDGLKLSNAMMHTISTFLLSELLCLQFCEQACNSVNKLAVATCTPITCLLYLGKLSALLTTV